MLARLSPRLEQIAAWVPRGSRLLDVGTDHALLPIALMERGMISFAVASDIAIGPIRSADENVARAGLRDHISVRHAAGLQSVAPGEVDTVVIAGMGGSTIADILQTSPDIVRNLACVILQPMNAMARLRTTLEQLHLSIQSEQMIAESGKTYQLILAVPQPDICGHRDVTDLDVTYPAPTESDLYNAYIARDWEWLALEFGPLNLQRTADQVVRAELRAAYRHWTKIQASLHPTDENHPTYSRWRQLEHQLLQIRGWLESNDVK